MRTLSQEKRYQSDYQYRIKCDRRRLDYLLREGVVSDKEYEKIKAYLDLCYSRKRLPDMDYRIDSLDLKSILIDEGNNQGEELAFGLQQEADRIRRYHNGTVKKTGRGQLMTKKESQEAAIRRFKSKNGKLCNDYRITM